LLISAFSLAIALSFVDLKKLGEAFKKADYRLVLISISLSLVWLMVRGLFWRTLLQEKASYRDVFLTLNEGYLLNNVLPFRLGEVARSLLLAQKAALAFWEVFSTIVIERAMDIAYAVSLVFISLPFVVNVSWAQQAAVFMGIIVVIGWITLYFLAHNRDKVVRAYQSLRSRHAFLQKAGGNAVPAFLDGLSVLTDSRRFLRATGWVSLNWAITISQYFILLRAFFPDAEPIWAIFGLGAAALGIAAPSSPGNLGVFEVTLMGALYYAFGVDQSGGLAFAVTAHLLNYVFTSFIGAYALAKDGETLTGLYRSARNTIARISR
jgi:uncharacterized protein (TIRG00374 family)